MEPAKLTKLVRGELDWIVMKALEKDRNRRYETANGFAMDVQRYLADEPVQACSPSTGYRLRKFVRRNNVAFWTTGLITLALIVGTIVSVWQAVRATRAETLADARRQDSDSNFQKARQAVDRYFTLVSEETLLDTPGLQPLREKLLQEARNFYEDLRQQRNTDPTLHADLTVAYLRMAEVSFATGKGKEAHLAFEIGMQFLDELLAKYPDNAAIHRRLAGFWKGDHRLHEGMTFDFSAEELARNLQTAARIWEEFVRKYPAVPEFQSDLSALCLHAGELYLAGLRRDLSFHWQTKGREIAERLSSKHPTVPLYRYNLDSRTCWEGISSYARTTPRKQPRRYGQQSSFWRDWRGSFQHCRFIARIWRLLK
jgi:hypothetical protein